MRYRLHKLLLLLVMLSVALSPLRGVWALPEVAMDDTEPHCAGMQHDTQQMNHHDMHGGKTDNKPHQCQSGCNGSCCKQGCNSCLHLAAAAIAPGPIVLHETPGQETAWPAANNFPERHLKPPLRPPLRHL
jgi:hypothetical protein